MSITQTQTEPIGTDYEICHSGRRPQLPIPPVISSGGLWPKSRNLSLHLKISPLPTLGRNDNPAK